MKKVILVLTCLLSLDKCFAQYILAGQHGAGDYFVDINPDTTIAVSNTIGSYTLDINGDNISDFIIDVEHFNGPGGYGNCQISPININNSEVGFAYTDTCMFSAYDMCYAFSSNNLIDNNNTWVGGSTLAYRYSYPQLGYYCDLHTFDSTIMFIGVRVQAASDTLYGWIKVKGIYAPAGYADTTTITIEEYACNLNQTKIPEYNLHRNEITIFPNPMTTSAIFVLSSNVNFKDSELKIFDVTGRQVKQIEIRNRKSEIKRENLSSGIYFYKVQIGNEIAGAGKLIIQ